MITLSNWVDNLQRMAPSCVVVIESHVDRYGSVSDGLLMNDILHFAIQAARELASASDNTQTKRVDAALRDVASFVETALATGDTDIRDLVQLWFVEDFWQAKSIFSFLLANLGPLAQAEIREDVEYHQVIIPTDDP